jgi:hypothetical protein
VPYLIALDGCAGACIDDARLAPLSIGNVGATSREVIVAVVPDTAPRGPFTIAAALETISPGAECTAPLRLDPGTTLAGQDNATGGPDSQACWVGGFRGDTLHYEVAVPAGRLVRITATPSVASDYPPLLSAAETCSSGRDMCLVWAQVWTTGAPVSIPLDNAGGASTRTFVVAATHETRVRYSIRAELM